MLLKNLLILIFFTIMANQKQNFTRSNVNESTLQISAPDRSGFDMSHRVKGSYKLGVLHPVNIEYLTPTDMFQGSLHPDLQFKRIVTPELGRVRLDTHNFVVMARRINKDWRQFAESSRDFSNIQKKPSFDPNSLFGAILCYISDYTESGSLLYDTSTVIDLFVAAGAYDPNDAFDYDTVVKNYVKAVAARYANLADIIAPAAGDHNYLSDFFYIESDRLEQVADSLPTDVNFAFVIDEIMKPYFGIGSIMDSIGYPIFRDYSMQYNLFAPAVGSGAYDFFNSITVNSILSINFYASSDNSFDFYKYGYLDEMPFRAIYAAWYDYLRNWHVEKRTNLLDPDLLGSTSVFSNFLDESNDYVAFSNCLALLLPKFRMFGRDALTTVQEDDVYRHVYAPIDSSNIASIDSATDTPDLIEQALSIALMDNSVTVPFMGNLFNRDASLQSSSAYMADLQTMKRAKMLEKFLARDFYNPDTYAGFIRARYSVVPDDIDFLSSVYLGGNEQMMNGEQKVSDVSTSEMVAGTRTFVGGGSVSDSFSYRASDFAYVVSFVSLMPMVVYDAANMHMHELTPFDLPLPEFADDTRVAVTATDILRGVGIYRANGTSTPDPEPLLGFVPRYYQYRARLDEAHGEYLTDMRSNDWLRDWYTLNFTNIVNRGTQNTFSLDPYSLRVHLPLDMFLGLKEWDFIAYGKCDVNMSIDRPLPAAIEFI